MIGRGSALRSRGAETVRVGEAAGERMTHNDAMNAYREEGVLLGLLRQGVL